MNDPEARPVMQRVRRWTAVAVAVSAVVYVAYATYSGWGETGDALVGFRWLWMVPILATTLINYGLRWAKWRWLLTRLDVHIPVRLDLFIYAIGLMMTLSPGKAGEVVKPWLVRRATGAPMLTTVPVLVVERLTDALAILALATLGAVAYASDQVGVMVAALGVVLAATMVLGSRPLTQLGLAVVARLPLGARVVPLLARPLAALHTSLTPGSLLLCFSLSLVAWFSECVGTWLVFKAFGVPISLGTATFLYAFATGLGAISPGGVGVTDATLISGAQRLVVGMTLGTATAAALVLRVATLWFGVLLGALALLFIERELTAARADPTPRSERPRPDPKQ